MNINIVIAYLSLWLILNIIIKLKKKKQADYSFIVTFIFILVFAYFYFYGNVDSVYYEYYYYTVLTVFPLFITLKILKVIFKKDVSEFDYYALEKEIEELNNVSELLRNRFVSTIELLNDGMCFKDEGESFFGTDKFIALFGLENNMFTEEMFESKIYKDDLSQYKAVINRLSKKQPVYNTTYRVVCNNEIVWIKEVGKKMFVGKKESLISIIKPMDIKQFPDTETDVLNQLPLYKPMYEEMQKLIRLKTPYHFMIILLTNIPQINEKYGRDVGDLMMGEYLKKLRFNFIKDNLSLYRIEGIKFGLIIKDQKKFDLLNRALTGGGDLLNLKLIFGGITQTLYPNLGITESPYEGKSCDQVINEAKEALEITLKESYDVNYCFYDSSF